MKKFLSLMLAAVMCTALFAFTAYAADDNIQPLLENSWRYKDGQVITDPYTTVMLTDPYHPDATFTGIDVSHHQGEIDWEKVKESDVDFAIIRCGYAEDKAEYDDRCWEYNTSECERLGIPYGVYLYSYAENVGDAISEADHVLRLIEGKNLSMPVYYDLEENYMIETELDFAAVATAFCERIEAAGHPAGVYANLNWWTYYLTDECFENWHRWLARWNTECGYDGEIAIWQYYNMGVVEGIDTDVDMNFLIGTPADHKVWTEKLETPVLSAENATYEKPVLSWNAAQGAEQYQVWRKTGAEGRYVLLETTDKTTFTDESAQQPQTYSYMVKAVCADSSVGNSYFSEEKTVACLMPTPTPVPTPTVMPTPTAVPTPTAKPAVTPKPTPTPEISTTPMYRLYNPNSGEHFYTGSKEERGILTDAGWIYEGVAWNAPTNRGEPVYRIYNPNSGDHHYTMSEEERDILVNAGWIYEGIAWNSASADNVPLYRLYNPNADCGSHHYTGSMEERDFLVSAGWILEGIGWFGMVK